MSQKREPYWFYVKSIIREYPALLKEANTPLEPKITASYGIGGGFSGQVSKQTENCVIHQLPSHKQKKLDALESALRKTKAAYPDRWEDTYKMLDMLYWKRTHTAAGIAKEVNYSENTVGKWNAEFIRLVADELELI